MRHSRMKNAGAAACAAVLSCLLAAGPVLDGLAASPVAFAAEGAASQKAGSEGQGSATSGGQAAEGSEAPGADASSGAEAGSGSQADSGASQGSGQLQQELPLEGDGAPNGAAGTNAEGAQPSGADANASAARAPHITADDRISGEVELSDDQSPAKAGTIIYDGVKYVVNPDGQTAAAAGWHGDVPPAGDLSIAARVVSGGDSYRVVSVSDEAFKGCELLRTVALPDGLESVGKDAFAECPALESFLVGEGSTAFATFDGMLFDAELETLIRCPEGKRDAALLPDTAKAVEQDAFAGCAQLAAITAGPDNPAFATVDNILYTKDRTALLHAPARTVAAVIALEATTVAEGAFAECSSLASILSLGAVEVIEDHAFARQALESAVVALAADDDYDARKAVWEQAGFSKFQTPAEPGAVQKPAPGEDGFVFELLEDYTLAVSWGGRGEPDADLSIPASGKIDGVSYRVSAIAPGGFAGIERLTNVQIRAPIAAVGDDAFAGCANLSSVIFEEGMSSIGAGAFAGTAVESMTIPASVSFVGAGAFSDCSALSRILAFSNTIDVASDALSGCSGVAVYCPVESEGAYPWNPGLPVTGNHILPYGVSFASEPLVLAVGETADVFEGGVREVPEGCELSYSYAATPLSVENGQATGKKPGTSEVSAALALDGTELARATRTVEVREAATADDPADQGPAQDGDGAAESADEGAQDPSADIEDLNLSLMSLDSEPRMLSETLALETSEAFETTAPTGQRLVCTILVAGEGTTEKCVSVKAADPETCAGLLQIPAMVENEGVEYKVVAVADNGFPRCDVESVILPDTIEALGPSAFYACFKLRDVKFEGSGALTIGLSAFLGCRVLTSVELPAGTTSIGTRAFSLCASLTDMVVPDAVTSLGISVFESCSNLSNVVFGKGIQSIPDYTFTRCPSISEVTFLGTIQNVSPSAFGYIDQSSLTLHVSSSEQKAWWTEANEANGFGIDSANIVVTGELCTVRFESASGEFAAFTRVVEKGRPLAEPATPVRDGYGLAGWRVQSASGSRWDFSANVEGNMVLVAEWAEDVREGNLIFRMRSDGESVSVAAADPAAVSGRLEIPASVDFGGRNLPVREVAAYGFAFADRLTSVWIPASVEVLNVRAFKDCSSLAELDFEPESSLRSIGADAAENCLSLKELSLPASLEDIGRAAFINCSELTSVKFEAGSRLRVIQSAAFQICPKLVDVEFPDSLQAIYDVAFMSCTSLASVRFPAGLKTLGPNCFNNTGLETVSLPESLTRLESGAFGSCPNLKSVELSFSFVADGKLVFNGCPQLTSVFAYGKMENSNISTAFPAEMKGESGVTIMLPPTAQDGTNDNFAAMAETWRNTHGFANVACSNGDLPAVDGSGTAGHWNLTSDLTLEITQVPGKTIAPLWTDETDHAAGYWGAVRSAVRAVSMDPALKTVDMNKWFKGMPGLASTEGIFIPEGCTNVHELFRDSGLQEIASGFTIPDSVSNAQTMFGGTPITHVPSSFRIPSVNPIDVAAMFQSCKNLVALPEGFFIPSNVTQAFNMFYRCTSLSTLPQSFVIEPPASGTTYARDFGHMFGDCISLGTLPDGFVINKNNVVVVGSMFENCTNLTYLPQSVAFDELKGVEGFDIMFGFDVTYPDRHEAVVVEQVKDVLARDGGLETYCDADPATWPDASVWAGWNRTPKSFNDAACRVSFVLSDGVGSFDGQPVWMYAPADDSGLVQEPEPPTYDGKVFTLWYADAACTQRYDFSKSLADNGLDPASKNVTIYGKYADGLGGKSVGGSLPTKADTGSAFWSITDEGTLYIRGAGTVDIPNWEESDNATVSKDYWGPYRSDVVKASMSPSLNAANMSCWFAFMENLSDATEVRIPSDVLRLRRAFQGCTSLTTLPEGLSLPADLLDLSCMFQQCSSLKSLPESFIPGNKVKSIQYMFWRCSSLSSLPSNFRIPDSVAFMSNVFGECASLRSLPSNFSIASVKAGEDTQAFFCEVDAGQPLVPTYYAGNNPSVLDYDWASQNRELVRIAAGSTFEQPAQDGTCLKYTVTEGSANGLPTVSVAKSDDAAKVPTGDIVVPETVELEGMTYAVTSVAESGFANCDKITSVKLPATVKVISKWAFDANASLASLPDMPGVQVIGMNAFRACVSLREAVLPATLTTLGALAFEYAGLESATIPASASTIAYAPFGQCSKLKNLVVEKANANYCVRDGALCTIDGKTLVDAGAAQSFAQDGCYTVPAGVQTIGQCAFKKLLWLKGLVLPASCGSIGYQAVHNNENLTDIVYLSSSVKNIGLGSISLLGDTRLHCFGGVASTFEANGLTNVVPFATGAPQTYELPENQPATLEFASSIPADLSSGIEVMWSNINTDIATIEPSSDPASTPDKHAFKATAKGNVGDSFTAEANLVYGGGGSTVVLATSQVTVSIINSRGALPTENNPSNTDENVAGWSLDADGTLKVWSTEKIADFGWINTNDARHTEHWGPVRAFVRSVDTTGVKDVNAMTCWFREMPLLTDISKFKIPETTKFVNDVFTGDKALEVIPDSFKFPDEATNVSSCFNNCTSIRELPADFKLPSNVEVVGMLFGHNPYFTFETLGEDFFPDTVQDLRGFFYDWTALETVPADFKLPRDLTNANQMFRNCTSLKSIPAGLFDKATELQTADSMFYGCTALEEIPEGFALPSKMTSANDMFRECASLRSFPVNILDKGDSSLTVSSFFRSTALESLPDDFKIPSNVTDTNFMFQNCTSLKSVPSGLLDNASNLNTMHAMFYLCSALETIPDGFKIPSSVENVRSMFNGCVSLRSIPAGLLGSDSHIDIMLGLFYDCPSLTMIPADFELPKDASDKRDVFAVTSGKLSYGQNVPTYYAGADPVLTNADTWTGWRRTLVRPQDAVAGAKTVTLNVKTEGEAGPGSYWTTAYTDASGVLAEPAYAPSRSGHVFTLWYADEACSQRMDFSKPITDQVKPDESGVYALYGKFAPGSRGGGLPCEAGTGTAFWSLADDGTLYVRGSGKIQGFNWQNEPDKKTTYWAPYRKSITGVVTCPSLRENNFSYWFYGCSNLKDISGFVMPESVVNVGSMFMGCSALKVVPEGFCIPDEVTEAASMFAGSGIVSLPSSFKLPSKLTNAAGMFYLCRSLASLPEGFAFTNPQVKLFNVLRGCNALTSLPEGFSFPLDRAVEATQGGSLPFGCDVSSGQPLVSTYYTGSDPLILEFDWASQNRVLITDPADRNMHEVTYKLVKEDGTWETRTTALTDSNGIAPNPGDPQNGSYGFTGWCTDEECLEPFDFSQPVDKATTLYGKWIKHGGRDKAVGEGQLPVESGTGEAWWQITIDGTLMILGDGKIESFGWLWNGDNNTHWYPFRNEVYRIQMVDTLRGYSMTCWFQRMDNLTDIEGVRLLKGVRSLGCLFYDTPALKTIPEGFTLPDTAYSINSFFNHCGIEKIPSSFKIPPSVEEALCLFQATPIREVPEALGLSIASSTKLRTITDMFGDCRNLETLPVGFTIPNSVKQAGGLFRDCTSLKALPEGFSVPASVAEGEALNTRSNMDEMFKGCDSLTYLPADFDFPVEVAAISKTPFKCTKLTKTYFAGSKDDASLAVNRYTEWESSQNRQIVYTSDLEANNQVLVDLYQLDAAGEPQLITHRVVEKGTSLNKPVAPGREGATFLGWYLEPECTNAATFPLAVTGATSLYAKYAATSGPLPTVDDPDNADANVAGWRLDADGTLHIWCEPGAVIKSFGWDPKLASSFREGMWNDRHWGYVRDEVKRIEMTSGLQAEDMVCWFAEMHNLVDVSGMFVPENVKQVNRLLFRCSSLEVLPNTFAIPEGVVDVSDMFSMSGLHGLPEGFALPSTTVKANFLFANCPNLKSLPSSFVLPPNVEEVQCMFGSCKKLESLPNGFTLPDSVVIANDMFSRSPALVGLPAGFRIPDSVESVSTFLAYCTSLEYLPEGFTVPKYATDTTRMFEGCTSLKSLPESFSIPASVKTIRNMFLDCPRLTYLPASLDISALSAEAKASAETLFGFSAKAEGVSEFVPTVYAGSELSKLSLDGGAEDATVAFWSTNYRRTLSTQASKPDTMRTVSFVLIDPVTGKAQPWTSANTEEGKITRPTDPSLFGYAFNGWYTDPECTTKFAFDDAGSASVSADTVLYGTYKLIVSYDAPLKAKVKLDPTGNTTPVDVQMKSFTPVPLKVSNVSCEAAAMASEILDPTDLQGIAAEIYPEGSKRPLYLSVGESDTSSKLALPAAQPGAPGVLNYAIGLDIPDASMVKLWHDGWSTDVMKLTYTVEPA